jgi:hypothetical protein
MMVEERMRHLEVPYRGSVDWHYVGVDPVRDRALLPRDPVGGLFGPRPPEQQVFKVLVQPQATSSETLHRVIKSFNFWERWL